MILLNTVMRLTSLDILSAASNDAAGGCFVEPATQHQQHAMQGDMY